MSRGADVMLLLLVALHALLPTIFMDAGAALQEGFYTSSTNCTVYVEATVVSVVQQFISADRTMASAQALSASTSTTARQGILRTGT